MSENPYAPPSTTQAAKIPYSGDSWELAGRFTRFAAAMVDGFIMIGILVPIQLLTGHYERVQALQVGVLEQLGMTLLGILIMLLLNGYLLYTRGQSIGKLLAKIQIVDHETGRLLSFFRVYVLRYLWI